MDNGPKRVPPVIGWFSLAEVVRVMPERVRSFGSSDALFRLCHIIAALPNHVPRLPRHRVHATALLSTSLSLDVSIGAMHVRSVPAKDKDPLMLLVNK